MPRRCRDERLEASIRGCAFISKETVSHRGDARWASRYFPFDVGRCKINARKLVFNYHALRFTISNCRFSPWDFQFVNLYCRRHKLIKKLSSCHIASRREGNVNESISASVTSSRNPCKYLWNTRDDAGAITT